MRRGSVAKEARRSAAEARQAARDRRTDEQQHRRLIDVGHGGCKEVERLRDRMTKRALLGKVAQEELDSGPTETD